MRATRVARQGWPLEGAAARVTETAETVCTEPPARDAELKSGASVGKGENRLRLRSSEANHSAGTGAGVQDGRKARRCQL